MFASITARATCKYCHFSSDKTSTSDWPQAMLLRAEIVIRSVLNLVGSILNRFATLSVYFLLTDGCWILRMRALFVTWRLAAHRLRADLSVVSVFAPDAVQRRPYLRDVPPHSR